MSLSAKLRRAPLRVVTGAFVLNSGLGKLKADEDTAKALHGMASGTYGFLGNIDPKLFVKGLAVSELVLGGALLSPFVSPVVAGAGLTAFSGGLLNLYWNTEGMHEPGDPRPTQQGLPIAKDVWMAGIGVGLMVDGLLEPAHDKKVEISAAHQGKKAGKHTRRDRRKAKKARAKARKEALQTASQAREHLGRRASKAASKAQKAAAKEAAELNKRSEKALKQAGKSDAAKQARKTSKQAVGKVQHAVDEYRPVMSDKLTSGAQLARGTAKDYADELGPVVAERAKQARDAAKDAYGEYAPVVVDRLSTGAKQARDTAKDAYSEYAPVVADKVTTGAKQVRDAAKDAIDETRSRVTG